MTVLLGIRLARAPQPGRRPLLAPSPHIAACAARSFRASSHRGRPWYTVDWQASTRRAPSVVVACTQATNEETSLQDLGSKLAMHFYEMQHPAFAGSYSKAVKDFTTAAILAYECGYSEDGIRAHLQALRSSCGGIAAAAAVSPSPAVDASPLAPDAAVVNLDAAPPPPAAAAPAGAASNNIVSIGGLRLAGTGLSVSDAEQCVMYVGLVWTTILLAPRHSVTRWAATPANSDGMLSAWRGFTTMIVTGYYEKRMAWFPLDRLQLELAATRGSAAPPPDAVAEMARIVYSTLEIIYPIFPSI